MKIDARRNLIVPGNFQQTIEYMCRQIINRGHEAIQARQAFFWAISGGTSPNRIYAKMGESFQNALEWGKTFLFWSDERFVPQDHPRSNAHSAISSGLKNLGISKDHIFCMKQSNDPNQDAKKYEEIICNLIPHQQFDIIMLGVGEDGHTASLFPETQSLTISDQSVIAHFIPHLQETRITFTYSLINKARSILIFATGDKKKKIVKEALFHPQKSLPVTCIGTKEHPALWILDNDAAQDLP